MDTLVRIIGIIAIVLGVVFILNSKMMRDVIAYVKQEKRIYLAGVIRIVVGLILLVGGFQCRAAWVVIALGVLIAAAGVSVFVMGIEKCRNILNLVNAKPDNVIRMLSIVPIVIGVLLILCA